MRRLLLPFCKKRCATSPAARSTPSAWTATLRQTTRCWFLPTAKQARPRSKLVPRRVQPIYFNERAASNKLLAEHVPLVVDLHAGKASARYWTCDFTAEYVRINASYRT